MPQGPADSQHREWGQYHMCTHQLVCSSFTLFFFFLLIYLFLPHAICRTFNPADYTVDSGTTNSHADVWDSGTNDATDGTGKRDNQLIN